MEKPVAIIDIDAVIVDTLDTMNMLLKKQQGPGHLCPCPTKWDWSDVDPFYRDFAMNAFDDITFYKEALPCPGAQSALRALCEKFTVHLMTARYCHNATTEELYQTTLDWLSKNGIKFNMISFAKEKLSAALGMYDKEEIAFIVEDNSRTATAFAEAGIPVFLISYPYNRDVEHENVMRAGSLVSAAASALLAQAEKEGNGFVQIEMELAA